MVFTNFIVARVLEMFRKYEEMCDDAIEVMPLHVADIFSETPKFCTVYDCEKREATYERTLFNGRWTCALDDASALLTPPPLSKLVLLLTHVPLSSFAYRVWSKTSFVRTSYMVLTLPCKSVKC